VQSLPSPQRILFVTFPTARAYGRYMGILLIYLSIWISLVMLPSLGWGLSGKPVVSHSSIALQAIVKHRFSKPVFLTSSPDETNRLFVVEQEGHILIIKGDTVLPTPFLDIAEKLSTGGERGLLGLAFHPHFPSNGRLFVNYTRAQDGATVIAEYHASSNPNLVTLDESVLLVIPQPYGNHNGGMIAFGPDHYLYIGMGDGGSGGDPANYAQNQNKLLGKLLRIDLDQQHPYDIPPDNPFVKGNGRPEIFAWGLRNPWRFSFDRETGDLWAGDVGQNAWEEIDVMKMGKNYGWRLLEGTHCFNPETHCRQDSKFVDPVTEYAHEQGRCSVTGGYVYRGEKIPDLAGTYVFGDFCSGEIWGYRNGERQILQSTDLQISSFGEDRDGELYVLGYGGEIFRMAPKAVNHIP
jgi:glucose/arabinose dehydrogenase